MTKSSSIIFTTLHVTTQVINKSLCVWDGVAIPLFLGRLRPSKQLTNINQGVSLSTILYIIFVFGGQATHLFLTALNNDSNLLNAAELSIYLPILPKHYSIVE